MLNHDHCEMGFGICEIWYDLSLILPDLAIHETQNPYHSDQEDMSHQKMTTVSWYTETPQRDLNPSDCDLGSFGVIVMSHISG